MSLSTWWRYRWMELRATLYGLTDLAEFCLKLLVNWFLFFTAWLWVGFSFVALGTSRAIHEKKSSERAVLTGKIWYWDQFRTY